MRHMYADGGEELTEIFRRVKAAGLTTSLDMAAVDPESEAGKADWAAILRKVLPYVDYFVPSVEELCFMADRPRYEDWLRRANGGDVTAVLRVEDDIRPLAAKVLAMGARNLLIKCGAPGLYFTDGTIERFEKSYKPDRVLSGHRRRGYQYRSLPEGPDGRLPHRGLPRYAAATGASCVEAYDALSGLRSFAELDRKIQAGWKNKTFHP